MMGRKLTTQPPRLPDQVSVPTGHLLQRDTPVRTKVLLYITGIAAVLGFCYMTVTQMAEELGHDRHTVGRYCNELEEQGCLEAKHRARYDGRTFPKVYRPRSPSKTGGPA